MDIQTWLQHQQQPPRHHHQARQSHPSWSPRPSQPPHSQFHGKRRFDSSTSPLPPRHSVKKAAARAAALSPGNENSRGIDLWRPGLPSNHLTGHLPHGASANSDPYKKPARRRTRKGIYEVDAGVRTRHKNHADPAFARGTSKLKLVNENTGAKGGHRDYEGAGGRLMAKFTAPNVASTRLTMASSIASLGIFVNGRSSSPVKVKSNSVNGAFSERRFLKRDDEQYVEPIAPALYDNHDNGEGVREGAESCESDGIEVADYFAKKKREAILSNTQHSLYNSEVTNWVQQHFQPEPTKSITGTEDDDEMLDQGPGVVKDRPFVPMPRDCSPSFGTENRTEAYAGSGQARLSQAVSNAFTRPSAPIYWHQPAPQRLRCEIGDQVFRGASLSIHGSQILPRFNEELSADGYGNVRQSSQASQPRLHASANNHKYYDCNEAVQHSGRQDQQYTGR